MNNLTDIIFEVLPGKKGDIGLITLNRPKALNAINLAMIKALHQQLKDWEVNSNIKAVIIKSNSEKAFCAGGDIKTIYEQKQQQGQVSTDFFWHEYRLNYYIANYPKPYIALMDGIAMGGGAGISVHGRYRIATEKTLFAMPETTIGFFPDVGGSYFLSRCPGQTGLYLALTSARIQAADSQYLGLTDYCIDSMKLSELIKSLQENSNTLKITHIFEQFSINLPSANIAKYQTLIDQCFSFNSIEEIIKALNKQNVPWSKQTVELILNKSPTSLKVTLEQLRRGAQLDLADCLKMEYCIANHMLTSHDFYEGIRAVMVDKDNQPQWQPKYIDEITPSQISKYFNEPNNLQILNFKY